MRHQQRMWIENLPLFFRISNTEALVYVFVLIFGSMLSKFLNNHLKQDVENLMNQSNFCRQILTSAKKKKEKLNGN